MNKLEKTHVNKLKGQWMKQFGVIRFSQLHLSIEKIIAQDTHLVYQDKFNKINKINLI